MPCAEYERKHRVEEAMNQATIAQMSKPCPRCGAAVSKKSALRGWCRRGPACPLDLCAMTLRRHATCRRLQPDGVPVLQAERDTLPLLLALWTWYVRLRCVPAHSTR